MKKLSLLILPVVCALGMSAFLKAADPVKPLRVLIVAGGCCHDYDKQKMILAEGLSARANVEVEIAYNPDKGTAPTFEAYQKPDWFKNFDVIVHDECAAAIKDVAAVENILAAHKAGVAGVNLHCAMHCYRVSADFGKPLAPGSEGAMWFDYLGLQSSGHGPQEPIAITFTDKSSPITSGMADWTTMKEELYNNVQDPKVFPNHKSLATGKQTVKNKDGTTKDVESVVVWSNEYGPKKTRVFSTTIGHNNETVSDAKYLDLVARGLLWSCGKLGEDGKPLPGYEAKQK
ncbi:ThuA domain-containing protein [soil metagenome]